MTSAAADKGLLVAIPAYNEEETVAGVVAAVKTATPSATVIVVDDGSSDSTASRAREAGAVVLELPFNVGVGGAMRAAFLYALDGGYSAVVQVDADGQHNPEEIPNLCEGLTAADVVVGARFIPGESGDYQVGGPRKWAMRMLSSVLSRATGTPLSDTTSGFRAAGPRAIRLFAKHYPSEYLGDTVESLIIAHRAGLSIAQKPARMSERQGGEASQNTLSSALYLGRALLAVTVALTRENPTADPGRAPA